MPSRSTAAAAALVIVALSLAGCSFSVPVVESDASSSPTVAAPAPTQTESDDTAGDDQMADALAERDQFLADQQLPLDGSPLVAVTPAQQEFIAQQREFIESQGGTWDAQTESISLALAADACETAILNYHEVDAPLLQAHVASSPVFAQVIPADFTADQRAAAERNVASVMVFGAGFLCPEDGPQWEAAFTEVYG
ncbi:hypothetical protein QSU92_16780 [Microbacterium sp. ET2]|uniref:hypothetical protein n=1 Tax=Microbacterium albipurpureum TaxID=3050384 RepID=UPI00259CE4D9|nr:hypothetical protein [Microbacterium sp. ET2 (Ac-2212)]WJL95543.1 hypothetical protein QSU92_16780 [Microbacterium sp. ET2 (Ac-2212)]